MSIGESHVGAVGVSPVQCTVVIVGEGVAENQITAQLVAGGAVVGIGQVVVVGGAANLVQPVSDKGVVVIESKMTNCNFSSHQLS